MEESLLTQAEGAAQVSDQTVRLWQEGWFTNSTEFSGVSILRNPKVTFLFVSPLYFPCVREI